MFGRLFRKRKLDQVSQLTVINRDGGGAQVIYETDDLIEAPYWTPDGQWLIFNGGGRLFRVRSDGSAAPELIDTGAINAATNDHLVSPDGQSVYFTSDGCLYAVALTGGVPRKVSNEHPPHANLSYYLHGISPDGQWLSFVGVHSGAKSDPHAIYLIAAAGGAERRLTHTKEPVDGPEFSPDGRWIYFNSELNGRRPGHSQLFRMHVDGTHIEQLTSDERVNWFPHASPDGQWLMYLSYAEKTQGHPANVDVLLRVMPAGGGAVQDVVKLFGGQGTTNVNGWAPDSQRFAFMAYPVKPAD
ncbi:MAG: hypothetical protein QM808_17295 [Steroidobacteraceae bacterium]